MVGVAYWFSAGNQGRYYIGVIYGLHFPIPYLEPVRWWWGRLLYLLLQQRLHSPSIQIFLVTYGVKRSPFPKVRNILEHRTVCSDGVEPSVRVEVMLVQHYYVWAWQYAMSTKMTVLEIATPPQPQERQHASKNAILACSPLSLALYFEPVV